MKRSLINFHNKKLYKEQIAHIKGYYIDRQGDIYYKNKIRIPSISNKGYKSIKIRINTKAYNLKYHRLQAYQKFGDKIYKKGIEIRHLDNNPSNNNFENIAIGSHSQNYYDSLPEVIQQRAQKGGDANKKFNHHNVVALHNQGFSYNEIMKFTGIKNKGTVSWIINHSTYSKNI